jgi:hypothetical protein
VLYDTSLVLCFGCAHQTVANSAAAALTTTNPPQPQPTTIHTHSDLKLGKFTVKLNHRLLLDAMLAIAGVPPQKFRPICRCVSVLKRILGVLFGGEA